jgi:hypothetical protein
MRRDHSRRIFLFINCFFSSYLECVMRSALKLCAVFTAIAFSSGAYADGAFIQQATGSYQGRQTGVPLPFNAGSGPSAPSWTAAHRTGNLPAAPQFTAPAASGGNFASTLEMGNYNKVFQAQNGSGNLSNVGIIGGNANNVGVFQDGNNLRSNLALINTQGLPIAVIQQPGAAPVNMLIARLPNGSLLIRR